MSERGRNPSWSRAVGVALAALLAVWGCTQNGGPPTAVTPQERDSTAASTVVLAVGQSTLVAPSSQLTFQRVVGDSRCPTGVQCAWAGEVEIALELQTPAGTESFQLSNRSDAAVVLGLAIKLVAVEPYPRAQVPIPAADYRASLRVTRN